jgi:hypothetical protein
MQVTKCSAPSSFFGRSCPLGSLRRPVPLHCGLCCLGFHVAPSLRPRYCVAGSLLPPSVAGPHSLLGRYASPPHGRIATFRQYRLRIDYRDDHRSLPLDLQYHHSRMISAVQSHIISNRLFVDSHTSSLCHHRGSCRQLILVIDASRVPFPTFSSDSRLPIFISRHWDLSSWEEQPLAIINSKQSMYVPFISDCCIRSKRRGVDAPA